MIVRNIPLSQMAPQKAPQKEGAVTPKTPSFQQINPQQYLKALKNQPLSPISFGISVANRDLHSILDNLEKAILAHPLEHILETDKIEYSGREHKAGLPLSYPRTAFYAPIKEFINKGEENRILIRDLFGIHQHPNKAGLFLTDPKLKLSPEDFSKELERRQLPQDVQADLKQFYRNTERFLNDNKVVLPPQYKDLQDSINDFIRVIPEYTFVIDKKQHGTQQFSLDGHMLKGLQHGLTLKGNQFDNYADYQSLSKEGKFIYKMVTMLHDIAKTEKLVVKRHPEKSARMAEQLLKNVNIDPTSKQRIVSLVKHHHWVERLSTGKITPHEIVRDLKNPEEDFKILQLFARADLAAVGDQWMLNNYGDSWIKESAKIRPLLNQDQ